MRTVVTAVSLAAGVTALAMAASSCGSGPLYPDAVPTATAGSASAALAPASNPDRTAVCHFDETRGGWTLLSVPAPALQAHLERHDDARPGGTTPSGVALGPDCARTTCPCFDTGTIVALFTPGPPARPLAWGFSPISAFVHDLDAACGPWLAESLENYVDGAYTWSCVKTLMGTGTPTPPVVITQAQHTACVSEIGAAQVALGLR